MPLEVNASSSMCRMCGKAYGRLKGYFPISYGTLYKGVGYMPYCNDCVDSIYETFFRETNDAKLAARYACRKLDIYWREDLFEQARIRAAARSLFRSYIMKANSITFAGKTYDDTLKEERLRGISFNDIPNPVATPLTDKSDSPKEDATEEDDVAEEVKLFWGPGYSNEMYRDLEQRRAYYLGRLPDGIEDDIGSEAMLRQICALDLDINRDRAEGKPVDKNIATLTNLLGELQLKPKQKKESQDSSAANTTFGEWIKKWEDERPIPDIDPELKDVDGIVRHVSTWFFGHLAKMLGIKNAHSKLYEEAIEKYRVDNPEYEDESDDELIYDVLAHKEDDDG